MFDRRLSLYVTRDTDRGRDRWDLIGHRVQFEVQKFASPTENRGTIRIYNLNENLRRTLATRIVDWTTGPYSHIFLSAGYQESSGLILSGVVYQAVNTRSGQDWITELQVKTGWDVTSRATVNVSFAEPTSRMTVANKLFESLNRGKPQYSADAAKKLQQATPLTGVCSGKAADHITRLLGGAGLGLTWTLDDDGIKVMVQHGAFQSDLQDFQILELNPATGVIGTPQVTHYGVDVRMLLNHTLSPGDQIFVRSASFKEVLGRDREKYTITVLRHSGDTHGQDWSTSITGEYANKVKSEAKPIARAPSYENRPK